MQNLLLKISDVPMLEAPDGGMRNSVTINEETVGAAAFTAGILTVRPGGASGVDLHEVDEFYYIIDGSGTVTVGDVPYRVTGGDFLFLPGKITHRIDNEGAKPLAILWVTAEAFSRLPDIRNELAKWPVVQPGK